MTSEANDARPTCRVRGRVFALALAAAAACSGGGDDGGGGGDPPPAEPARGAAQGLVAGASSAAAPGGHRVVAGILGGPTETRNAQHTVRGGIQP